MEKDTLNEFKEFISKYTYADIKRDRTDAEVCKEFNDLHKALVMLYHCDFAQGEITIMPLNLLTK